MRAHDRVREMRHGLIMQQLVAGDSFGVKQIIASLRLLYEEV